MAPLDDSVGRLLKRAQQALARNEAELALSLVDEATAQSPELAGLRMANILSAQAWLKLGEAQRARQDLEEAARIAPHNERVRTLLEILSPEPRQGEA